MVQSRLLRDRDELERPRRAMSGPEELDTVA